MTLPANTGATAAKYKLTLTATGTEGRVKSATIVTVRIRAAATQTASGVADGGQHSCALLSSGHVDCWGVDKHGELGNGLDSRDSDEPVEAESIDNASQVAAGGNESCALLSTGHIDCWGENSWGQLGDGTTDNTDTPVEVQGLENASQVAVGGDRGDGHACGLLSTGHVDCWGLDRSGELGDGTKRDSTVPVEVQDITDAIEVSAADADTCALLSTGHIDCWGANFAGWLGNATTERSDTPVEVQDISDATQVSAGAEGSMCALLSTGEVECWGYNEGDLGDGTTTGPETCSGFPCSTIPVEVSDITDAAQISAGGFRTCAVLSTGHVDCWGSGGLGNGTNERSDTPVEVKDINNGSQVASGGEHACALLSTGDVECWGGNRYGELGDGEQSYTGAALTPVEVFGL